MTVTDADGAAATASFSLTVNSSLTATTAVTTTTLTQNHIAAPFTPVNGSGGTSPLTYSVTPMLPAGLGMSSSTGLITGTPTGTSAATTYMATVTDAESATAVASFSLAVNGALAAITAVVASTTLTQNRAVTPFAPVAGSGGTGSLVYSVTPMLPAGLVMSSSTGLITGTATGTSAPTTYTVVVTDTNNATATARFSVTVDGAATATTAVAASSLTLYQSITAFTPVVGTSGAGTLSYRVSPALPNGLNMNGSTGALSGTPGVVSPTTTYTVAVTDGNGSTATANFSLAINQQASTVIVTVNPTSVTPLQPTTLTATVAASIAGTPVMPGGSVTFSANGKHVGHGPDQ